jgi:peptidoglycan/xylan/chitin deacetylase (PgdA/CDA1 family)
MRVVSSLLKRVVYPCLAGAGYFRALKRMGLAVVTYHGVVPADYQRIDAGLDGSLVTAETLRRQLRILKSNYSVISPEEMFAWCRRECELPTRAVLITCDDGLQNNVTEMLPILQEEGVRGLFFVTGASAGETPSVLWYQELLWLLLRAPAGKFQLATDDVQLSGVLESPEKRRELCGKIIKQLSRIEAPGRERFLRAAYECFGLKSVASACNKFDPLLRYFRLMTRKDLKTLVGGGMTIGAHTLTHPVLAEQAAELAWSEIGNSRALLEAAVGQEIWALAYPFGGTDSISPRVLAMAKEAGFAAAFMNIGGGLGAELPLHAIPRVHVSSDMTLSEFEAHISGFYQTLLRILGRQASSTTAIDIEPSDMDATEETASKRQTA